MVFCMGSLKIKEEIMKEKLKTILIWGTFFSVLFLVDYNRVTSCGYAVYYKCNSYYDHYFK